MSIESIFQQLEDIKEDFNDEEFKEIKSILDNVKYRQNDYEFEIINESTSDEELDDTEIKCKSSKLKVGKISELNKINNKEKAKQYVTEYWSLDEKFELSQSLVEKCLRKQFDDFLINKDATKFYKDFPILDFLINRTEIRELFNEKLKRGSYNKNEILENVKFLYTLNDSIQNNTVVRACVVLSVFDYLSSNYSFCDDNLKFKSTLVKKINYFTTDKLDSIVMSFVADKFGSADICKIWLVQM